MWVEAVGGRAPWRVWLLNGSKPPGRGVHEGVWLRRMRKPGNSGRDGKKIAKMGTDV